jgi:hypothetical protein
VSLASFRSLSPPRIRFEAIAATIFDSVPEARRWNGGALLRELLIVKGGKKGAA